MLKTGIMGLGAMGAPMARRLHQAGFLSAVWNRTAATAQALGEELGVTVADSPVELAEACEVIVTCVSGNEDVLSVGQALLPALTAEHVVVDTSTISSETARTAASMIQAKRAGFLDAPVSGGVEGAEQGNLTMMVGGDANTLERVRPVLRCLAQRITHMGRTGSGQATKAVNQVMVAGIAQAVTEALAFGEALELNLDQVIDVVRNGAAGNWFLEHRGRTMVRDRFDKGFKLRLLHKDLRICKEMSLARGAQLPIVEMSLIHYRRLMESGYGEEDISALIRQKRELFKPGK